MTHHSEHPNNTTNDLPVLEHVLLSNGELVIDETMSKMLMQKEIYPCELFATVAFFRDGMRKRVNISVDTPHG